LPPRPVSGPAPVALPVAEAGPEIEGLVLDIFHSLYRKSVSNEIVLREKRDYLELKQELPTGAF